jgi:hypothetical protein
MRIAEEGENEMDEVNCEKCESVGGISENIKRLIVRSTLGKHSK